MPADFCLSQEYVNIRHPTQNEKYNRGIAHIDPAAVPAAKSHAPQPDKPVAVSQIRLSAAITRIYNGTYLHTDGFQKQTGKCFEHAARAT